MVESTRTFKGKSVSMSSLELRTYPTELGSTSGVKWETRDLNKYPIYCTIEVGESMTIDNFPSVALSWEEMSLAANVALLYSIPTTPTAESLISFSFASVIFICVCLRLLTFLTVCQNIFILSKYVLPLRAESNWSKGGASPITTSCKTMMPLLYSKSNFLSVGVSAKETASSSFDGKEKVRMSSVCLEVGTIPTVREF